MNKVVLFSGQQGSGKTTAAYNLKSWAYGNGWNVLEVKFADPLYAMHNACLHVLREYGLATPSKDGALLQLLGTEYGRTRLGEDIWAKLARNVVNRYFERMHALNPKLKNLVTIDDCRFMNELEIFPEATKVRLVASRDIRKARAIGWRDNETHPSETQFDGLALSMYFDAVFDTDPEQYTPEMIVKRLTENYLNN